MFQTTNHGFTVFSGNFANWKLFCPYVRNSKMVPEDPWLRLQFDHQLAPSSTPGQILMAPDFLNGNFRILK